MEPVPSHTRGPGRGRGSHPEAGGEPQGILAFNHREMTLTLLGMHAALQFVSQGLQEMVLDRVETLEPRDEARPHPESGSVPIEEAEHAALYQRTMTAGTRGDEVAMMQMGGNRLRRRPLIKAPQLGCPR